MRSRAQSHRSQIRETATEDGGRLMADPGAAHGHGTSSRKANCREQVACAVLDGEMEKGQHGIKEACAHSELDLQFSKCHTCGKHVHDPRAIVNHLFHKGSSTQGLLPQRHWLACKASTWQ
jgi:hypothetical protein